MSSAAGPASHSSSTEICRFFLKGTCRFGANCFYSHDVASIQPQTRPQATACRNFLAGYCSYGDNCIFDHKLPADQPPPSLCHQSNHESSSAPAQTQTQTQEKSTANQHESSNPKLSVKQQLSSEASSSSSSPSSKSSSSSSLSTSKSKSMQNSSTSDICPYFEKAVACPYGTECFFSHATTSEEPSAAAASAENTKKEKREEAAAPAAQKHFSQLCPYYEKNMNCPYGRECVFIHGDICDICNAPLLHPFDQKQRAQHKEECTKRVEKEMEEAFAYQRSSQKCCGICMECVWEKENTKPCDRRFGILENCNHVFCLPCIRKWRSSKSYDNKIVKSCPECRVKSDYVTPSRYWFEDEESKRKIINDYKSNLCQTPCKYFKQGDGTCPFGNKCFYLHRYKDGRLATDLPEPTKRHRLNRFGALEMFSNRIHIDFDLSDDELNATYDEDDFYTDHYVNTAGVNEHDLDFIRLLRRTLRESNEDSDDSDWSQVLDLQEELISIYELGGSS